MKARAEVGMDTIWSNQVVLSVECEFDNQHTITEPRLAELMVQRLKVMVEEVRHADERALPDLESAMRAERHDAQAERERAASEELQRVKGRADRESIFADREPDNARG